LINSILTSVSVALPRERFGNAGSMNYKLDYIMNLRAFCFHSFAIQFMSSVTVKCYTFHVLLNIYLQKLNLRCR
jgi:hypothetical protein